MMYGKITEPEISNMYRCM